MHNFVRLHACFSAFWDITGKANKTESIRPLLPAIGLEGARAQGARAPCAPRLDPPMHPVILRTNKMTLLLMMCFFFGAAGSIIQ